MEEKELIFEKLFRKRENAKKIDFIVANTGIKINTIVKAAIIARKNNYHNFGHEIGATEMGIKIAQAERLPQKDIDLIAISLLIHDAGHKGMVSVYDEMRSIELASEVLSDSDIESTGRSHNEFIVEMRDNVLSTIFSNRGKTSNLLSLIMQDADLAHLGQGSYYWVWASMGLIDEFNKDRNIKLDPISFIKEEQIKFVKFLESLSRTNSIWLSRGAQKIFSDPISDVYELKNWKNEAINFADKVKYDDITLEEFETHIKCINKS